MGMPPGSSRFHFQCTSLLLQRQLTVEKQVEEVTTAAVHSSYIPSSLPHRSFARVPAAIMCLVYQSGLHESEHPLDTVAKRYRKPFTLSSNDHLSFCRIAADTLWSVEGTGRTSEALWSSGHPSAYLHYCLILLQQKLVWYLILLLLLESLGMISNFLTLPCGYILTGYNTPRAWRN